MSADNNKALQDLALIVTVNCVRNTVIEDYHARGSLSQEDMKAFNKQVANNIYTFLVYAFDRPGDEFEKWVSVMGMFYYPHNWDTPEFNEEFEQAIKMATEKGLV